MTNTNERFFNKVLKLPSGCWIWMGAIQGKYYKNENGGYGSFRYNKKVTPAHIASCHIHGIKIPKGLFVDHLCRTTLCVNPDHLEPVTPLENSKRAKPYIIKKTHCPSGHEYTPENTKMTKDYKSGVFYKACRICRKETERKSKQKAKINNG